MQFGSFIVNVHAARVIDGMTGEEALASWKIWDLKIGKCGVAPEKTLYNDTHEVRILDNQCLDMDITTNIIEEINAAISLSYTQSLLPATYI